MATDLAGRSMSVSARIGAPSTPRRKMLSVAQRRMVLGHAATRPRGCSATRGLALDLNLTRQAMSNPEVILILKILIKAAAPVLVSLATARQRERGAFNAGFAGDSDYEVLKDESKSVGVRSRMGRHVAEARWVSHAGASERCWQVRTRPPHTALRTFLLLNRASEIDRAHDGRDLSLVRVDDPGLEANVWVSGKNAATARKLMEQPKVRAAIADLFGLAATGSSEPLVSSLAVERDGHVEALSPPVSGVEAEDARRILRHTLLVIAAMTADLAELPAPTVGQRAEDLARAQLLAQTRLPIQESSSSPLQQARHSLEGDIYVCSGNIQMWLPSLSIYVSRRRIDQPGDEPPERWVRCQSSQFAAAFTTYKEIQDLLDFPMTTLEIRRQGPGASELIFKRLWLRDVQTPVQGTSDALNDLVAHIERAMGDLRSMVHALEDLGKRGDWHRTLSALDVANRDESPREIEESAAHAVISSEAPIDHNPEHAAAPAALFDTVVAATARLSGNVERVGTGVQTRLTLPLGAMELTATVVASPQGSGATMTVNAELPLLSGASLQLSPERGLAAWMRTWQELEVGITPLDNAFLIEGNAARVPEVSAARVPLLSFASHDATIVLGADGLSITLQDEVGMTELPALVAAALELWEAIGRRRLGVVDG